jgi:hypothetical protein
MIYTNNTMQLRRFSGIKGESFVYPDPIGVRQEHAEIDDAVNEALQSGTNIVKVENIPFNVERYAGEIFVDGEPVEGDVAVHLKAKAKE